MPTSMEEWSDQHFDRVFTLQTSQSETAKVVITLTLAVAGAFVASALQVKPPQGVLDVLACVFIGLAFLLTVATIVLDRLTLPSKRKLNDQQVFHGWSDEKMCKYISFVLRDLEEDNGQVIRNVRHAASYQVLACAVASSLAIVSLFVG